MPKMKRKLFFTNNIRKFNLPVHEIDSTPGPKYSIIAPVPPLTVKIPANLRITSLGDVQPLN
jgi:hypothetical protein